MRLVPLCKIELKWGFEVVKSCLSTNKPEKWLLLLFHRGAAGVSLDISASALLDSTFFLATYLSFFNLCMSGLMSANFSESLQTVITKTMALTWYRREWKQVLGRFGIQASSLITWFLSSKHTNSAGTQYHG